MSGWLSLDTMCSVNSDFWLISTETGTNVVSPLSICDWLFFSMLIVALAGDECECPLVHMTISSKTVDWFSEIDEWYVFSKSRLVGLVLIRVYLVAPWSCLINCRHQNMAAVFFLLTNRQNILHMIITITKLKEFLITKKNLKHFDTCNCKKITIFKRSWQLKG